MRSVENNETFKSRVPTVFLMAVLAIYGSGCNALDTEKGMNRTRVGESSVLPENRFNTQEQAIEFLKEKIQIIEREQLLNESYGYKVEYRAVSVYFLNYATGKDFELKYSEMISIIDGKYEVSALSLANMYDQINGTIKSDSE